VGQTTHDRPDGTSRPPPPTTGCHHNPRPPARRLPGSCDESTAAAPAACGARAALADRAAPRAPAAPRPVNGIFVAGTPAAPAAIDPAAAAAASTVATPDNSRRQLHNRLRQKSEQALQNMQCEREKKDIQLLSLWSDQNHGRMQTQEQCSRDSKNKKQEQTRDRAELAGGRRGAYTTAAAGQRQHHKRRAASN